MAKIKHIYVDGKLVGIGDVKIKEIEKEPEYFLKIIQSSYVDCPFDANDDVVLYSNHKDYNWNDAKLDDLLSKFNEVPKNIDKLLELLNKAGEYNYVAVYGYEHSGLSVSLTPYACNWDSGLFGILRIDKSFAYPQKVAENWVETINMWLNGDVYCINVIDELGICVDCFGDVFAENAEDIIEFAELAMSNEYHFTKEDYKKAWEERTDRYGEGLRW